MSAPDFWDNPEKAQIVLKNQKSLSKTLKEFEEIRDKSEKLDVIFELCKEMESNGGGESDDYIEFSQEADETFKSLSSDLENMELNQMLNGEYDFNNAILSIHAGAGGLDAQDWASILLRMYTRWGENKGYNVKILDIQDDPEAGIKSATISFEGENAYGYLKAEKGVHRIVRISPYNTSGKRMTSFAAVEVMPELDLDSDVVINPDDIEIQTYRSSGAGGQHVNTTDSAVRIIHKPSGVVVQCQNERSQTSNKATAMKMLLAKLTEIKISQNKDLISEIAGDHCQNTWGSQIRSYVFQPYTMVKDHRTNEETGNIQAVIDGDLDHFIKSYLRS